MKWSIGLLLFLFVLGMPCVARSQADDILDKSNREPLHGISRVFIDRIVADENITKDGLDTDAIKLSIENKLRIAGLKIAPAFSMFFTSFETRPQSISVEIESLKIKDEPIYCYTVRFEVTNYAVLIQDKVSRGFTVWEQHTLGYAGTSRLSVIKETCDKFADKFVNDWLTAKDEVLGA